MKYLTFKLIEELDIDGDKNPDGFLINLCTLDKNNNIIYLKSKYITFADYNKIKKGGNGNSVKITIKRSAFFKNPDLIKQLSASSKNIEIIFQDDDDEKIEEKKDLPEKVELKPSQLRKIAKETIQSDKNNELAPEIKRQLQTIVTTKNDNDLIISELKTKIEIMDRDNQNQKINDIKQMQMLQHMQLMNISNQNQNQNQSQNSGGFWSNFYSGLGWGAGMGFTHLLFGSLMVHPYYSYNYGFYPDYYYPGFYDHTTIIQENYFIDNSVENIDYGDVNVDVGDTYGDTDIGDSFGDVGDIGF